MSGRPRILLVDLTHMVVRYALGGAIAPEPAAAGAIAGIARIAGEAGARYLICAADHPDPTWRSLPAQGGRADYKAGRSLDTDPFTAAGIAAAEAAGWRVLQVPGWEGDDVLAALTVRCRARFDVRILTGDSDALALVTEADAHAGLGDVLVCHPLTGGKWELRGGDAVVAKFGVRADQLACYKALAGEAGDNVEGIGGRTPAGKVSEQKAKARKLIAAYGSLEGVIREGEMSHAVLERTVYLRREHLRQSRHLVTLRTDVPLPPLRPGECRVAPAATAAAA